MTPFLWVMAGVGGVILSSLTALYVFDVWAVATGRESVSGYMKNAPRLVVISVGFALGLIVGALFSHWYWPVTGVG